MATDYYSDNEAYITNQPLPSPSGTSYQSLSRRTSRYETPLNDAGPKTAPLPPDPQDTKEINPITDETVSVLDPRRFTPTLQANLVSEILNLRRELDSKDKLLDGLETSFHEARNENESLVKQLSSSKKDEREMKRQLQQFESGALSALEEIANERDAMKESNADLKKKLEGAQIKLRNQDDDSTRVHDMWATEKEAWSGEKRSLERRVHISEGRLKRLLDDIAAYDAAREEEELNGEADDLTRGTGFGSESDAGSIQSSPQRRSSTRMAHHSRNFSNSSYRSVSRNYLNRMSLMSGTDSRANGITLADELAFDEEEEELVDLELDSDDYPENEMRARRILETRQSMLPDEKAKRVLGLSSEHGQADRDNLPMEPNVDPFKATTNGIIQPPVNVNPRETPLVFAPPEPFVVGPQYVDTGVQPSPPQSPVRPGTPAIFKPTEAMSPGSEVEANQRRKRVSAPSSSAPSGSSALSPQATPGPYLMISSSSQTSDEYMSPDSNPVTAILDENPPPSTFKPEVASISTQTDPSDEKEAKPLSLSPPKRAPPPPPISIPTIAVHAPESAPQSPKEPILPPGTKTIATQTTVDMTSDTRSTGMQTEPIRIDQRPIKLPPHLLPSAIRSTPSTPEPLEHVPARTTIQNDVNGNDSHQPFSHVPPTIAAPSARQDLKALLKKIRNSRVEEYYPGNNDNGPLAREKDNSFIRPIRSSSLFAGFDAPPSDEEGSNTEMSDGEDSARQWSTPMLSSRNAKSVFNNNNRPSPVPEEKESSPARVSEDSFRNYSSRTSMEQSVRGSKSSRSSVTRQSSIRRSAMIQNGTATHMRSRSPSIGSSNNSRNRAPKPPFPVPTRSSSRVVSSSKSEGSQSPTVHSSGSFAGRRPYGQRLQRQDSVRRVRSAAVIQKNAVRQRSRSPPLPLTPVLSSNPSLPPLPLEMMARPGLGHRHQLSTNTTYTGSGSVESAGYQASVVDAIAVAMVGEWMWKYVRKRKAFGGQEAPPVDMSRAGDESLSTNGVRHKRWVWISPYERSVLWSNKQPTSGPALLGKSGRKLIVQSVLDVADNTALPKNAGTQTTFNRSILILTPARALKFTTVSRERHYMWLTALSFLAHSSAAIPEAMPIPEDQQSQYEPKGAMLRRSHIHDSVRLAKGKANPVTQRYQPQAEPLPEFPARYIAERPLPAYADPPVVPRGPSQGHGRKRSSTGPSEPPPNIAAYRSFSHQQVPSVYSSGSSDMYSSRQPPSAPSTIYNSHSSTVTSTRPSESSMSTRQQFFDNMGTVRMEAFIDDSLGRETTPRPSFAAPRQVKRSGSQWSGSTNEPPQRSGLFNGNFMAESNDPFHGF